MRMIRFFLLPVHWVAFCALAILAGGCLPDAPPRSQCGDALGCVWIKSGSPVKIVSLHTFSGILDRVSQEHVRSLELILADRGGELHGHPVVIVREDEQCSRVGGLISAQKIATDESLVAVHGPNCSSAAIPATRILSDAGLTLVSGTATAPSLTSHAGRIGEHHQPGFFRTAANDEFQGVAAAYFAYQVLGARRVATVHDQDAYAVGLSESFAVAFQDMGGTVVFNGIVSRGDRNMRPLVQALTAQEPELVFFPLFSPEADHLIETLQSSARSRDVLLLSADSLLNRPFLERCGSICQGMLFVAPDQAPSPAYVSYLDRYFTAYGEGPQGYFHAHGYDAASILIHALERSSFPEPDGSLRIERQRLRDTLNALRDFSGLTGELNCDAFGDCGVPRFKLVRLDHGMDFDQLLENMLAVYVHTR